MEPDHKNKPKEVTPPETSSSQHMPPTPSPSSSTSTMQQSHTSITKDAKKEDEIRTKKILLSITARGNNFQVSVQNQCLISEISQTIDNIISEISKSNRFKPDSFTKTPPPKVQEMPPETGNNQISIFADKLGVDAHKLSESGLLGIKDDDVQIIKVSKITPVEAGLLILAVKDLLLNQKPIAYDEWKDLCDASGIRSNSPLYMISNNAKNAGYIHKEKYNSSKEMLLTPKGIKFVKKAVEKFLNS